MSDENLTPVQPTEDMRLPDGSAVFQIIYAPHPDGSPNIDMRGVLINTSVYDPMNPAHRMLAVINNHIDALVHEALGSVVTRTPAVDVERRLGEQDAAAALGAGAALETSEADAKPHADIDRTASRVAAAGWPFVPYGEVENDAQRLDREADQDD